MKNRTLRLLCLLLSVLMLIPLPACADNEDNTTDTENPGHTQEEVTEEDPYKTLDVPALTFGNYDFNVLSADYKEYYTPIDVEALTSEIVSDAIYTRNRTIEDVYKIKFHNDLLPYPDLPAAMEKQVKGGGDGDYDLIMLILRNAYTATLNNYLLDYENLEYVDVNKEYYFEDLNDQFTIANKMFFAFSAESVNVLSFANCLIYNKKIAVDHGMPDFYDMVDDGKWTFEELFKYAEDAANDVDGDGKMRLGTDVMGLIGDYDKINPAAWISAGEFLITKDENDIPAYTAINSERFIEVMQYVLENYAKSWCVPFTAGDNKRTEFMDGKSFMLSEQVGSLISIRSMSDDYGLLPWPKYDLTQERYYSRAEDAWLHCVPTTCSDTARTSAILQALAYYSYHSVYDAYYSQALSAQYVRDARSVDMLKQILSTMVVDIGDNVWYQDMRMPLVSNICQSKGSTKMASTLKKYQKVSDRLIRTATEFAAKN